MKLKAWAAFRSKFWRRSAPVLERKCFFEMSGSCTRPVAFVVKISCKNGGPFIELFKLPAFASTTASDAPVSG